MPSQRVCAIDCHCQDKPRGPDPVSFIWEMLGNRGKKLPLIDTAIPIVFYQSVTT